MKYSFITVLYGDKFIDTYLDVCLPFQVDLLREFSKDDVFSVYCPQMEKYWTEEKIQKLAGIYSDCPPRLELHPINHIKRDGDSYHGPMTNCHRQAMEDHAGKDSVIVFLSPDVVYANNAFSFMKKNIEYGYKAVLTPMFRTIRHLMVGALTEVKEKLKKENRRNLICPRDLLMYGMSRTHPMTDALFYDANPFCGNWPSHVYFQAPFGIIGHCWHQHPMAIVLEKSVSPDGTIDADLLIKAGIHKEEIRIAVDSDEFCAVELTDIKSHWPLRGMRDSPAALAAWGNSYCSELDKWYFQHRMRWHVKETINWYEAEIDETIFEVNKCMYNETLISPYDVHF